MAKQFKPSFMDFAMATVEVLDGALCWWHKILFFCKCGRLSVVFAFSLSNGDVVVLSFNGFPFLKRIDWDNSITIPKYSCHHFLSRKKYILLLFFWSRFPLCSPLFWLYFCFRCIMMYPSFIYSNELAPKLGFIAPKLYRQSIANVHLNMFLV